MDPGREHSRGSVVENRGTVTPDEFEFNRFVHLVVRGPDRVQRFSSAPQ